MPLGKAADAWNTLPVGVADNVSAVMALHPGGDPKQRPKKCPIAVASGKDLARLDPPALGLNSYK